MNDSASHLTPVSAPACRGAGLAAGRTAGVQVDTTVPDLAISRREVQNSATVSCWGTWTAVSLLVAECLAGFVSCYIDLLTASDV